MSRTLVVYKNCKIEIEREGNKEYSYSIWDEEDGSLVANDCFQNFTKKEVIQECQSYVDDYMENPEAYK